MGNNKRVTDLLVLSYTQQQLNSDLTQRKEKRPGKNVHHFLNMLNRMFSKPAAFAKDHMVLHMNLTITLLLGATADQLIM